MTVDGSGEALVAPTCAAAIVKCASLLEDGFPAQRVSQIARASRSRPASVYGAHKWWARRPARSVRALLLAATIDARHESALWPRFYDDDDLSFASARVGDPFVGGGTSLVEAQRLGAAAFGIDVDPLAVLITEHGVEHLDRQEYLAAAESLFQHLTAELSVHFESAAADETPLHYFYLRRPHCPECGEQDLLYRSLVLARDLGRRGAVVRDVAITAFCPLCLAIHHLPVTRKTVQCCGRRWPLDHGSYRGGRYECACGERSTNEELRIGLAERVLVGVEVTDLSGKRRIRAPSDAEAEQEKRDLVVLLRDDYRLILPRAGLVGPLKRHKPGIYGFDTMDSLFSPRQRLIFGTAFRWLVDQSLSRRVKSSLALAISNALSSNNLLCGYATDYGRLAPLFSVRDYSLPALSVELNPLHPSAGRGTLRAMLRRVAASKEFVGTRDSRDASVHVADASVTAWPDTGGFDIVMTDPPYYDYIAYSDLSLFFRVWLGAADIIDHALTGQPLYEGVASRDDFATRLGQSLEHAAIRLKPGGLVAFTYHATTRRGWEAVSTAISTAGLALSAAFPLWADGKSPGHGHDGNVEYDIVLCCRMTASRQWERVSIDQWLALYPDTQISNADRDAWSIAADELNKYAKAGS